MAGYVPWSSQPFDLWSRQHAKGKFVDLGGRRTHYIERGQGAPVVLIHGFAYDSHLWAANIDALAAHFKVYAIDLWGFGYSTREPLDYGYPLYAEQILLFMDALGIARASLVGQSLGAGTAMLFCLRHRPRVDKLLLVAAAGLPNPLPLIARFSNLPGIGEFLLGLDSDLPRQAALKAVFIRNGALLTREYFEEVTRSQKIEGSIRVTLAIQRKQFFDKLGPEVQRLGQMQVPALLVWGRQDKAIGVQHGHELRRLLSGSRLEILDHAGHVPNFERAEDFNRLAVDFLGG